MEDKTHIFKYAWKEGQYFPWAKFHDIKSKNEGTKTKWIRKVSGVARIALQVKSLEQLGRRQGPEGDNGVMNRTLTLISSSNWTRFLPLIQKLGILFVKLEETMGADYPNENKLNLLGSEISKVAIQFASTG